MNNKFDDIDLEMLAGTTMLTESTHLSEAKLNEAMYMIFVDSSNIDGIWYEPVLKTTGNLFVKFKSGHVYQYYRFREKLFNRWLKAESYGKFFWRYIRGKFPYRRMKIEET